MPNSVGEREGKKVLWEEKLVSLGKKNGCLGEQMGNKKVCDNICLCGCKWSFRLLHDYETPSDRGFILGLY